MSGSPLDQSGGVVVAARRGELSYLLINHLADRFDVVHVVFERFRAGPLLRYRLRRLGVTVVVGQLLMSAWDRLVIRPRSRSRNRELLEGSDTCPPDGRLPTTEVRSINGSLFTAVIEDLEPAVIVVSGTGIIAERVLTAGPTFLNIHCGITPDYRGVHGAFWAITEGRPELAGSTIHVIDTGVDTGPIVAQRPIDIDPSSDTMRTLLTKQYLTGLEPMADAVADVLAGRLRARRPADREGRQWFSPTLADHWRFRRRLAQMRGGGTGGRDAGSRADR